MNKHQNPDGTYNGAAVLSELTSLSQKSVAQIWTEVKANLARLKACPRHDFEPLAPLVHVNQRYRCVHCSGEIDYHAHHWHEQGRRP